MKKLLSKSILGIYVFKTLTKVRLFVYGITNPKISHYTHYLKTKKLILDQLQADNNCIDVGASKGDILDIILNASPKGSHITIEALPMFHKFLKSYYPSKCIRHINAVATNFVGETNFYFIPNEPAISGSTQVEKEMPQALKMKLNALTIDSLISINNSIDFLKLDCIGSELEVLLGAKQVLQRSKPLIVFDCLASHYSRTRAAQLYRVLNDFEYTVYNLTFYPNKEARTQEHFLEDIFEKNHSHYFAEYNV